MKKKFLALLLALAMVLALAACGGGNNKPANNNPADNKTANDNKTDAPADTTDPAPAEPAPSGETDPEKIDDTMTSADNKYVIAMVTDVGQLKDKSFNQGTWNGVKLYASQNGKSYKYYQPANGDSATDEDRYQAYKAAIDGGAEVIVAPGFLQEAAMVRAASEYPDVKFVFIDGYPLSDANGNALNNVVGVAFHEEQCGYLAGYAAVKEGNTKLGFTGGGGGTNPAVNRYGYGFVQGAQAAAAEDGVNVEMNYSYLYGDGYSASAELQTQISGWYSNGTEIVFACGGSMFNSVAAAAAANDGLVVGVDVDQSAQSETVVTSAMKGLASSVQWAVAKVYDGTFSEIGGKGTSLGAKDDAVGLPTATWSLENYTIEEYEAQLADMASGKLVVDSMVAEEDFAKVTDTNWSNVALNYIG